MLTKFEIRDLVYLKQNNNYIFEIQSFEKNSNVIVIQEFRVGGELFYCTEKEISSVPIKRKIILEKFSKHGKVRNW